MLKWMVLAAILFIFLVLFLIQVLVRAKRPFRKMLLGLAKGVVALALVNLAGSITGIFLPVSTLSLAFSAVGGIPAVSTMLLLGLIL